jgi:hypothetical protein
MPPRGACGVLAGPLTDGLSGAFAATQHSYHVRRQGSGYLCARSCRRLSSAQGRHQSDGIPGAQLGL